MQNERCAVCGKKNLREVQPEDFCFLRALEADKAAYFEENLKRENIPVATLGVGLDLRTRTSGAFKIFIPYRCFDRAKEIYSLLFEE